MEGKIDEGSIFGIRFGILNNKTASERIQKRFCGGSRIRTGDPMLAKHVLYQLSYTPLLWGSFCQSVRWTSFFSQSQPEGCSFLHHSSASSLPKITSKSLTKNAGLVAGIFGALATPPAGGRPGRVFAQQIRKGD